MNRLQRAYFPIAGWRAPLPPFAESSGAAKTHYWVDPQEELIGLVMTQYMMGADPLASDFRVLAYQALIG